MEAKLGQVSKAVWLLDAKRRVPWLLLQQPELK